MNIYNMSSGDSDPNNDFIRMQVAMDANSYSSIRIYNSGGSGVLEYNTNSDYAWKVERVKYISEEIVPLETSQSQKVGYPDSISWVPGNSLCSLSNFSGIDVGKLKPLTKKEELNELEYVKSGYIFIEDYYESGWSPQGVIQVSNVYSNQGNMPFVDIKNSDVASTGIINIYSSSLDGCVFSIDLKRNFISGQANDAGSVLLPEEFKPIYSQSVRFGDTYKEWDSIFDLNEDCNADSIFRNGKNRDEAFSQEMEEYLNKNWYDKLKRNLWGSFINDENVNLSSRDPEVLKNHIFYCFYYFGASDDIYNLSAANKMNARWHIDTGGKSLFSENRRIINIQNSYLPVINQTKPVSRVYGLPPRTAYTYNLQNNINVSDFVGSINPDGTTNPNGSSASNPNSSNNY